MSTWQPIETAPSKGEFLIVYEAMKGPRVTCAKYEYGILQCDMGGVSATHWMPLPEPPEGKFT